MTFDASEFGRTLPSRIVIHPSCSPGVRRALKEQTEITVEFAESEDDVLRGDDTEFALVIHRLGWRQSYLVPNLVWVQSQGSGQEGFPVEEFRRRDVIFTTGRGLHPSVAEHAIGMLIALLRDTRRSLMNMEERLWDRFIPNELSGRGVGILGMGHIGEGIASRLQGWDVDIVGVTRNPSTYNGAVEKVVPLDHLRDVAHSVSVLFVTIASTPETRGLVSADVMDALGPGWIVNVARGPIVDEKALIARLADNRLAGAGLDVFEFEPLPNDSRLWEFSNVVCTPHMAGESKGHPDRFLLLFTQNVRAYTNGVGWRNRVC